MTPERRVSAILPEAAASCHRRGGVGQLWPTHTNPLGALSSSDAEGSTECDLGVMNISNEVDLGHVLCDP